MEPDKCVEELDAMLSYKDGGDPEQSHIEADQILLTALREAGRGDVADAWERVKKRIRFWYS